MKPAELKQKRITMSTLKSFIRKSESLFVLSLSDFDGMTDCVQQNKDPKMIPVSQESAIGHSGVWCVGSSRDYFGYYETPTHYGIRVSNSCGSGVLLTPKP